MGEAEIRAAVAAMADSFLEADFAFRVGSADINDAETDLEIFAGLDALVPFAEIPDPTSEPDDNGMIRGVVGNMSTRIALAGEPVPIGATQEWLDRLNNMEYAVLDENGRGLPGADGLRTPIDASVGITPAPDRPGGHDNRPGGHDRCCDTPFDLC